MSGLEGNAQALIESIFELHRFIISIFFKNFEETYTLPDGLNFTHMKAAIILRFHGKMTMSELSSMLTIEKGSFTPVAGRLIEKGIVMKERSKEDKRVYKLVLTAYGQELTDQFKDEHWSYMSKILDQLSSEERADYFEKIQALNEYNKKITDGGT